MRKQAELSSSQSCMAHAHPHEMTFVLLGRDAAPTLAELVASERCGR